MRYFIEILKCRLKLLFMSGHNLRNIETIMYGHGWGHSHPEPFKKFKKRTLKEILEKMNEERKYPVDGLKHTKIGLFCRSIDNYGITYTVIIRVDNIEKNEKS